MVGQDNSKSWCAKKWPEQFGPGKLAEVAMRKKGCCDEGGQIGGNTSVTLPQRSLTGMPMAGECPRISKTMVRDREGDHGKGQWWRQCGQFVLLRFEQEAPNVRRCCPRVRQLGCS